MPSRTTHQRLVRSACVVLALFVACQRESSNLGKVGHEANEKSESTQTVATDDVTPILRQSGPKGDYAGSQACSECHAGIAETYHDQPMSRTFARVSEVQEPHENYIEHTSFKDGFSEFRVEREGDRVWHHEIVRDDEGVIIEQCEEIQFALGSGAHGRTYMMWREGGMYISPISWFADKGWGLSPQDKKLRFHRRVQEGCLQCHSGRYVESEGQKHLYPPPVFHEMSIGCESCHGPGKAHVDYRRSSDTLTADPIVNPTKLASTERDAVCNQCHLVAEDRFLRTGLKDSDFRPGQKLSDIWLYFVSGTRTEGKVTEAVSQALQMQSSQCYIKSEGRLGCISCHSAHHVPDKSEREMSYRQKCLNCHAERGCSLSAEERHAESVNDSCIHCHMPPLSMKGIPHASQSDHRILRRPNQSKKSTGQEGMHFYAEEGASVPPEEFTRAKGLMLAQTAEANRDRRLALESLELMKQSVQLTPNDEVLLETLGAIHEMLGNQSEAELNWKRIFQKNPRHENAIMRLAIVTQNQKRFPEANEYFKKLVNVHGWQSIVRARYAYVLGNLGKYDEALEQLQLAVKIDPLMLPAYDLMSQCYVKLGDLEKAQATQIKSRRLKNQMRQRPAASESSR